MTLGYEPTVQILIERGANVNNTNNINNSALLLAAAKGQNYFRHTKFHTVPSNVQ